MGSIGGATPQNFLHDEGSLLAVLITRSIGRVEWRLVLAAPEMSLHEIRFLPPRSFRIRLLLPVSADGDDHSVCFLSVSLTAYHFAYFLMCSQRVTPNPEGRERGTRVPVNVNISSNESPESARFDRTPLCPME